MSALWYILKLLVLASWQGFYHPIDPKINPHLCLDMMYPAAKFDVDWSKETQVILKKNPMFDARPITYIPNLITRFHLVKTCLTKHAYIHNILILNDTKQCPSLSTTLLF